MTEQQWTVEELEEIKKQFNQSSAHDFEGIIIHDKVQILETNQTLAGMFGYEPSEIVTKTILELVAQEVRSLILRNLLSKHENLYQTIGLKKSGETFPIEIYSKTIQYQGRMVRVMGVRDAIEAGQTEILESLQKAKSELEEHVRETTIELKFVNQRLQLELDERRKMEAEIKTRARQQAAIAELGQRALVGTDLAILMDQAALLVVQTLETEYSAIFELMPGGETLLLRAGIGWKEGLIKHATLSAKNGSQAGYTLLSQKPVIVDSLNQETRFTPSPILLDHGVVSGMSVIIQRQNQPFGVLVAHTSRQRFFTEDDVHFLQAAANVLAMAIERKDAETQLVQRNRETEALRRAGAALSSTLDYEEVLDRILEQISYVIPHDAADLMLIEGDTARIFRWRGYAEFGDSGFPVSFVFNLAQTTSLRTMLETNRPLAIPNVDQYEAWVYRPETAWIKSYAGTPIHIRDQVIGFLNVDSTTPGFYHQADAEHLQDFAYQAAIAIENARLFEQSQTTLEEMATLYRVARTLAQIDNEQEMFELVLTEYLQRLKLEQGGILIFDDSRIYGALKAHMVKGRLVEPGLRIPVANNPACERLVATKEPVVINDVLEDQLIEPVYELTLNLGIKSLLLVPIVVRGEVIGALGADATETTREFTASEISLIKAMATQLGIALENVRLYAETQRHAGQMASLYELDRALTTSLRLIDIYHAFARHAIRLLPYDYMSITLLAGDEINVSYVAGNLTEAALPVGTKLPRKNSAINWVVERGQPLLRHNIAVDQRFAEDEHLATTGISSFMIIPLRVKGQIIGTWNIGHQQIGAYSPADLEIPQSMADQLAIAIENARLYAETRQRAAELATLNEISQAITSTLDLQEMLTIITERTVQLLGVAATAVALYNESQDDLWFAAAHGQGSDFVRNKRLAIGQGIVGWVVEHSEPVLILDVSKDPRFFGDFDQASGFTTRSILCVPLQTKGHVIGAIEVMNKANRSFDQQDLQLLSSLAAPAAAAIENARLFEQAQQEIAERKRVEIALQESVQQLQTTYKQAMIYAQELKEEVAERKRAEAALEEERVLLAQRVAERTADLSAANTELARAVRLKDEFLASMSHELRTPLTAILGLSELLKLGVYGTLTDQQIKSVQSIDESGRHLLALINDILDLSKIEAGKLDLQIGLVSVEAVCQASLQFIKQTASKKQLKVSSTVDKGITTLQADERRLKQILVNLLSNAVKFTPEGGAIGLEVVGDVAQNEVYFTVWDTGIGISPEDMPRLFQPFIQLDSSLSRQYAGTGLGLALVQRMVGMLGGSVAVESEVGQGSRFIVSLPWPGLAKGVGPKDEPEPVAAQVSDDSAQRQASAAVSAPLILLAEDEEVVSILLADYLRGIGYRTVIARNGVEALERAREERPALTLMDVQMPEMDGLEATRRFRAEANLATIPIIALTALAMPGDRERCLKAGANEYLSKPVHLKDLAQMIEKQLQQHQPEEGNLS